MTLKEPKDFKLIGTPAKRLDTPAKVNGTAVYGIDVRPPGVKIATLAQSPVFGGRLKSVNDAAALAVKGVRQIVRLDDAVAVVADHMGAAKKGLEALVIEWDDGPHAKLTTAAIAAELEKATLGPGAVAQSDGRRRSRDGRRRHQGRRDLPGAVPRARRDGADELHGSCPPGWLRDLGRHPGDRALLRPAPRKPLGLPLDKVVVHNHLLGGGFGRRLEEDGVVRAVQIARHVDGPVKVVWTREEDIQHDMYRPYWFDRLSAGLDAKGTPVAWTHRFAGSSVIARYIPPAFKDGLDPDSTEGAIDLTYALPNLRVEYRAGRAARHSDRVLAQRRAVAHRVRGRKLHGRARGGGEAGSGRLSARAARQEPAREGCARARGREGRLGQARCPRALAVASRCSTCSGATWRYVAEVEVAKDGAVRVRRVVCALDCGTVVNPDTVRAQVESGVMFGITAALYGEITLKDGRVEQGNFDSYQILRMNEAPKVEVHVIDNGDPPGGLGEAGTSLIVPAVANAIFAATGKRLRKMPVDQAALKQVT